MSKKRTNEIYRCWKCGVTLSNGNCRKSSDGITGYAPLCIDCEEKWLADIAQVQGVYEGLFSACIAFNVPCVPRVLDGVDLTAIDSPWKAYLRLLKDNDEYSIDEIPRGFTSGVKSIFGIFGNDLSHKDFAARIKQEIAKIQVERKRKQQEEERLRKERENQVGTDEQRTFWGTLPIYKGLNWTCEIYNECDRQLNNRLESLKGITITPQIENTLMLVAKNSVIYDHLMRQGYVKQALDVQKSIDLALSSEQLRKKDEKPQEHFRIDSQIMALERAGLFEDGKFLSYEETCKRLVGIARKKGKYDITLDMVDNMVLDYWNTMRKNSDQMATEELPEELEVVDDFEECAKEATDSEIERKNFAGATEVQIARVRKDNP